MSAAMSSRCWSAGSSSPYASAMRSGSGRSVIPRLLLPLTVQVGLVVLVVLVVQVGLVGLVGLVLVLFLAVLVAQLEHPVAAGPPHVQLPQRRGLLEGDHAFPVQLE